jgi:hypothetical protein
MRGSMRDALLAVLIREAMRRGGATNWPDHLASAFRLVIPNTWSPITLSWLDTRATVVGAIE